jgi:hypothetical protein
MEVTKWLKPSISVSRIGDSASVQAATRVNAEQSSKRTMRRSTRQPRMWKRSHGGTIEAPPDERGGNSYVRPNATAPHLDSTKLRNTQHEQMCSALLPRTDMA